MKQMRDDNNVADLFMKRLNKKALTYLKSFFTELYSKRELKDESEDESSSDSD